MWDLFCVCAVLNWEGALLKDFWIFLLRNPHIGTQEIFILLWSCLAAAMIMEACGGLGYTFAVYSQHIKEIMDYDQEDLDQLGAAKDFGYCLGIIGGIMYNFVPPWVTIVIGASMHFFGYSMLWMTTSGQIGAPGWLLWGFIAVGVGGDSWIDAAAIMTSLQNFEEFRGTAMGVLKAQVGLCGAIFVTLYKAFLKPNVDGYILLVAVAPAVASSVVAGFVWPHPCDDEMDAKDESINNRFKLAYGATIFLGLYLLTSVLVQAYEDLSRPWLVFFALTMLINLAFIWGLLVIYKRVCRWRDWWSSGGAVAIPSQEMIDLPRIKRKDSELASGEGNLEDDHLPLKEKGLDSQNYLEHSGDSEVFLTSSGLVHKKGHFSVQSHSETGTHGHGYHPIEATPEPDTNGVITKSGYHPIEMIPEPDASVKELDVVISKEEIDERAEIERQSLWENVQQINFWCLCLVAMLGPGSGLAVINNFGQIGKALGSESVELFVGLISIASCFGRLAAGYGSDVMMRKTGYPRPLCLSMAHLIMTVGCLTLAVGNIPLLYVGSFLVGGSYGAFWSLTPAIISEVFGLHNFAALYKLIGACSPVGAYILSAKVVGFMYDEEAEEYARNHPDQQPTVRKEDDDGDENMCMGRRCFGTSMIVLACVCVVGSCIGVLLAKRTRKLYARTKVTSPSM
ncbi:hypothetical protein R1flu_012505 [Riccia fluitans]|uniref:Nodulin-like domain-containing protein n=1 Tax=Riccia fluitans TaxID=41844 RepID=A0ABD1ZB15_9MARC